MCLTKNETKTIFGILETGFTVDGMESTPPDNERYLFEILQRNDSYWFTVETFIGFEDKNGCVDYMHRILKEVEEWMLKHNFNTSKELNIYEVFTEGLNAESKMKTIEDCYALIKFLIRGFAGQGVL